MQTIRNIIIDKTWNLEPGTWNLEPGTWNLEPGTWITVIGVQLTQRCFSVAVSTIGKSVIKASDLPPYAAWLGLWYGGEHC
jgi:hypothetical protein